jgi:uncharacterized protein YdeI (YjbR/CyaY-like superfamily)
MPEIAETFHARDRRAWRAWLSKHHARKSEIWLLLYKKHVDKPSVRYDEAVEEALCFGWIDGILKRIDDEQHVVRFSPRQPGSGWSESNKRRVRAMVKAGKMTEAGLALVQAAKKSGAWARAAERSKPLEVPADLRRALARNRRAQRNFDEFAPGYQRDYVHWVLAAKRDDTRRRRIREVVRRSAQNKKPGM